MKKKLFTLVCKDAGEEIHYTLTKRIPVEEAIWRLISAVLLINDYDRNQIHTMVESLYKEHQELVDKEK